MKKIFLVTWDGLKEHDSLYENRMDEFQQSLAELDVKDMAAYSQDLCKTSDDFLLEMSKLFENDMTVMYIYYCIRCNDFGYSLTREEQKKVCKIVYETWLKDESNLSVCTISDQILDLIENKKITIDDASRKAGRELLRFMRMEEVD